MPFNFARNDAARLQSYTMEAQHWQARIEDAENEYREATKIAASKLNECINAYNEFRNEVSGFVEDIASQAREEYDDKSERWQEGERGEATLSWIEALDEFVLVEEIDLLELLDSNVLEHDGFTEELANLPIEPMV